MEFIWHEQALQGSDQITPDIVRRFGAREPDETFRLPGVELRLARWDNLCGGEFFGLNATRQRGQPTCVRREDEYAGPDSASMPAGTGSSNSPTTIPKASSTPWFSGTQPTA